MKRHVFNKTIPVEPRSSGSPFSKVSTMEYKQLIQSYFPSLPPCIIGQGRFALRVLFRVNNRKSHAHPKTDLDNLIKPILDAGKHYFWHDDSQVDEISAKIRRHCNRSSITIAILQLENKEATLDQVESLKKEKNNQAAD